MSPIDPDEATIRVVTPARLHFGLLARGTTGRNHGGAGLMVDDLGWDLSMQRSARPEVAGPGAERVRATLEAMLARVGKDAALRVQVHRAMPAHVGFGSGTQLALALAEGHSQTSDRPAAMEQLVSMSGRGLRSGVGLYGYRSGGFLVDGGRGRSGPAPLIGRWPWPEGWGILWVLPDLPAGLHGPAESEAFSGLPPIPEATSDRLGRLLLMGILPALIEGDFGAFVAAFEEMQALASATYQPRQPGPFAHPAQEEIARGLRAAGLVGIGQSSWGPGMYGFSDRSIDDRHALLEAARQKSGLPGDQIGWARASETGRQLVIRGRPSTGRA